jgi:hypothetical protein
LAPARVACGKWTVSSIEDNSITTAAGKYQGGINITPARHIKLNFHASHCPDYSSWLSGEYISGKMLNIRATI